MDDDDWLESGDNIDENATNQKLLDNERQHIKQREQNQGYLDGLEFADLNYTTFNLRQSGQYYNGVFDGAIQSGIAEAQKSQARLSMLGKLLVKNVNCQSEQESNEVQELLKILNEADNDQAISAETKQRVDALLN